MKKVLILIISLMLGNILPALAKSHGASSRTDHGQSQQNSELSVYFKDGSLCTPISSPYASTTRYDGSLRKEAGVDGNKHGGIDLSLDEGTPLLAVASGKVFSVGEGSMKEGIYIWLLHLPEDTGLSFGFLTKYQHLNEKPKLQSGVQIKAGQIIATSGKTGTLGGHYGPFGYPHLHLTIRFIHDDKIGLAAQKKNEFLIGRDTTIIDPLILYIPNIKVPGDSTSLVGDKRKLSVAYVDSSGKIIPPTAKFVWPVACR